MNFILYLNLLKGIFSRNELLRMWEYGFFYEGDEGEIFGVNCSIDLYY